MNFKKILSYYIMDDNTVNSTDDVQTTHEPTETPTDNTGLTSMLSGGRRSRRSRGRKSRGRKSRGRRSRGRRSRGRRSRGRKSRGRRSRGGSTGVLEQAALPLSLFIANKLHPRPLHHSRKGVVLHKKCSNGSASRKSRRTSRKSRRSRRR